MQVRWPIVLVGSLLVSALAGVYPLLAEDVGKFSRVVNQVDQLKQGKQPALPAKVPNGVANQDQVLTKEQSMAVVQFIDDSTMTVSPKSNVTIEDYMYDADKGRSKGTIKVMQGVVETVIPTTERLQQKDIQIRTTTAIAGIRGTKLVTVAKPEGTVFYVVPEPEAKVAKPEKSKIRIRMYSPDTQPDAPAMRFVSERLKKNLPLHQILAEALEARLDPCELVKAVILLGVDLPKLVADFQQVCKIDPEYERICTPCIILKCAVEALRSLREVDIAEGQYGILIRHYAPIVGNLKPGDINIVNTLSTIGSDTTLPNYPPTQEQMDQAKLPQEVNRIAEILIQKGADPADINRCMSAMGVAGIPGGEAMAYSGAIVGENQLPGEGNTGQTPPESQASGFQ